MSPRQLTSLALLPTSPPCFEGHCPHGWQFPGYQLGSWQPISKKPSTESPQTAALSPVKGFCAVGNGESGPRCFLALGGWWQQSQGSTLTCEHCRGQDPGEEQQGHAQG